jgi:hypothetical protein
MLEERVLKDEGWKLISDFSGDYKQSAHDEKKLNII